MDKNVFQSNLIKIINLACLAKHYLTFNVHSDKYFLRHTGANLVNELFSFCLVDRQA